VKGVQLYVVEASAESDFETAFASLALLHGKRTRSLSALTRSSMPAALKLSLWRRGTPYRRSTSGESSLMRAG
jgi:hypothetical protein